jgi:integrase
LWIIAIDSGARPGELFALTWADVNLDRGTIKINKNLVQHENEFEVKVAKTKKSKRTIVLTGIGVEALEEHRKAMLAEGLYDPAGLVFCDTRGGYLRTDNARNRSLHGILKKADLPEIAPYALRHSSATLLLMQGEDLRSIADRLGHSTVRLTADTYAHVLENMQRRSAGKLDEVLRNGAKKKVGS